MLFLLMLSIGVIYGGWMLISFIVRLHRKLVYKRFWLYAINLILAVGTAGFVFFISIVIAAFSVDDPSTPEYVPYVLMLVVNAIPFTSIVLSVIDILIRVKKAKKWNNTNFFLENLSEIERL